MAGQVRAVTAVELDAVLVDLTKEFLPAARGRTVAGVGAPVIEDPRRFLPARDRYDVVLVAGADPASGVANRLYTRECFRGIAASLTADGVLGLRLRTSENFWTPAETQMVATIDQALRGVFRTILVLPGATTFVLASQTPLPEDPAVIVGRLRDRRLRSRIVSEPLVRYLYLNDRRDAVARRLAEATVPANTDARPASYRYAAITWLGRRD